MGAVLQLFQRHAHRSTGPDAPKPMRQGIRLPDTFDFQDLRAFLEAIEPAGIVNPQREDRG